MSTEAASDSSPPLAIPLGYPMHDDTPSWPAEDPGSHPPSKNSRRLPPPCWSQEETAALIEAYRDKWYSLRRGNLKAPDWEEVAEEVSRRCPAASPAKTAVQCRHKMEKLRKRYRAELQRARSLPVSRFVSSWVNFKHMDAMEKGPGRPKEPHSEEDNDDMDDEDDDDLFEVRAPNSRSLHSLHGNGVGRENPGAGKSGRFHVKIPTAVSIAQPGTDYRKLDRSFDRSFSSGKRAGVDANSCIRFAKFSGSVSGGYGSRVSRESEMGRVGSGKRDRDRDPLEEMVEAIRGLGDGFVRMEKMKMEMAQEIESMRMEMEMKCTEMILESQQRMVDTFIRTASEKTTRKKKMA